MLCLYTRARMAVCGELKAINVCEQVALPPVLQGKDSQ